jgi:hypothetical protein
MRRVAIFLVALHLACAQDDEPEAFAHGDANLAACDDLVHELTCGDVDVSTLVDCSAYADSPCDVGEYFDCLRDVLTCNEGRIETSAITQCASLAVCE